MSRRLPAEWEPQSGVMLTWPHRNNDWAAHLTRVEQVYLRLAHEISLRETVLIVCLDAAHQAHVARVLQANHTRLDNVRFAIAPSNDVWARDHGPITVLDQGSPRLLDFTFNGWGKKYRADHDNRINLLLREQAVWGELDFESLDFVLEGGGIESDGKGTLLVTTSCLLAPTRNPGRSRAQIEQILCDTLGVQRILWLYHGHLAGDDTDGHIDTLARFCDAHTIAYVACDNPGDEHFDALQAMEAELQALRDSDGKPYRLMALPLPLAKYDEDQKRLPATYANFLIINHAVLAPVYQDPHDAAALRALAQCFPDREIVAIDCLPLIQQYGSLHCVTMQLPAGVLR